MLGSNDKVNKLLDGLSELADSPFPKECAHCGKLYDSLDQLLNETTPGSEQNKQEGGIELTRTCQCSNPVNIQFEDRRAQGELAVKRRELFQNLLTVLTENGMPQGMAKTEIKKVMRGERSSILTTEQLQRFFGAP